MDTRLLYVLAVLACAAVGWFYYGSGHQPQAVTLSDPTIDYSARDIRLLQTDDTGQLQARTSAKQLQHYTTGDVSVLYDVQSVWYDNGLPRVTLAAEQARSRDANQVVELSGHVHVHQVTQRGQDGLLMQTHALTGYPRSRIIVTDQPVLVVGAQGQMHSQGMRIDLAQQDYQFYRIRIQYAPYLRPAP